MLCVWREGCPNHRWRDWYLCLGHINAIRVNKLIMAEQEARKAERPTKPYRPGDGGQRPSYAEPLAVKAVSAR